MERRKRRSFTPNFFDQSSRNEALKASHLSLCVSFFFLRQFDVVATAVLLSGPTFPGQQLRHAGAHLVANLPDPLHGFAF